MLKGAITALVTPMRNGAVDEAAFEKFVDWQVREGIHGVVSCGTTGESPTLTHDEHHRVTEICIATAAGRVPVIAGCGSNSTAEAVSLIRHAKAAGADASLVVAPYYNKPNPEGIYQHFKACAEAADLPLIVYNIPGRSVIDIKRETMTRIAALPNVIGVKDSTGDLARVAMTRADIGPDFIQLCGDDILAVGFNAMGGVGCISVTSNIAPKLCAEMQEATLRGDYAAALAIQDRLARLHDVMFVEPNPAPAKFAMSVMGIAANELRLPLVTVSDQSGALIAGALSAAALTPPDYTL